MGIEDGPDLRRRKLLQALASAPLAASPIAQALAAQKESPTKKQSEGPYTSGPLEKKASVSEVQKKKALERLDKPFDEQFLHKLLPSAQGYKTDRLPLNDFKKMKPQLPPPIVQFIGFENLHISGRAERFALRGTPSDVLRGRIERVLRFKNVTDAVELRYNLPPGILLSMIMQESFGADMLPNSADDGGAGLIHMQPSEAVRFGLSTFRQSALLIDQDLGVAIRDIISKEKNVFQLSRYDDRFHRVLALDAVGRMFATYMSAKPIPLHSPLRSAVVRYAGAKNGREYWNRLRVYSAQLHSAALIREVAQNFDLRNRHLIINGRVVSTEGSSFRAYIEASWEENERGFRLDEYRRLPLYEPRHSADSLRTYKEQLLAPAAERPANALKGSIFEQIRQNRQADKEKLNRVKDDRELQKMKEMGLLVPIPQDRTVRIDPRLDARLRFVRPWVVRFISDIAAPYYAKFRRPLQINSAIRTIADQKALRKRNKNAAPIRGPTRSSHLTGSAIDIAKLENGSKELPREELEWLRETLYELKKRNQIIAIEEFHQAVFHIMVFKQYKK